MLHVRQQSHVVYCHYDISTHEPCFVFEPLIVPHVTGKLLKTVSSRFFFSFVFKYITRKHATFLYNYYIIISK